MKHSNFAIIYASFKNIKHECLCANDVKMLNINRTVIKNDGVSIYDNVSIYVILCVVTRGTRIREKVKTD